MSLPEKPQSVAVKQHYLGSDDEDNSYETTPGPSRPTGHEVPQVKTKVTETVGRNITNNMIYQKLLEINTKLDNLTSRVSNLELMTRATSDTVMEMKRSFPRFITTPTATQPSYTKHYD